MVSVMKGLEVRKSRFAALSLDQDSGDEDETLWQQVAPSKSKQRGPPAHSGQTQAQGTGEEGKGLSKNAKKRARKRRNKSTSSDQDGIEAAGGQASAGQVSAEAETEGEGDVWRKKNEEAREAEFQKELREALVQSTIEAKSYEKIMRDMKEAEERALITTGLSNKAAKKTIKLSLQELHRLPDVSVPAPPPPQRSEVVKDPSSSDGSGVSPLSPMDVTEFTPLLEDVEAEVKKVMIREKRPSMESDQDREMMGPRIAQLKDELEKKDKIIAKFRKDNTTLKKSLTEAKERNQSLCTIMNQGEFSKKVELLKQVNELSVIKNDLALEVETLSSSLEQERSRNKALKAQVHQITNSHVKSKN